MGGSGKQKNSTTTTPREPLAGRHTRNNSKNQASTSASTGISTPAAAVRSNSVISTDGFELFEMRIMKSITHIISERFNEFEEFLLDKIKEAVLPVKNEFNKLQEEINTLKSELVEARSELESINRCNRMSDAIITGVPHTDVENPLKVLQSISECIDHSLSPYSMAFRAKSGPHRDGRGSRGNRNSPIIVKFSCTGERNIFLRKFKQHGAITLNQISPTFISDSKVHAFESLDRANQRILRKALWLRRNKTIHSAFTRSGLIYVKVKQDDSPLSITSMEALDQLILEASSGA